MKRFMKKTVALVASCVIVVNTLAGSTMVCAEEIQAWESYVGDMDAFVYGMLVRQYELFYDVFSGIMVLPDGTEIYGIAYTDYEGVFETDDNKTCYFPSGFIPLIGEEAIPSDLPDGGVEIIDTDYYDPNSSFVYAYKTEPFMEHCVIWDKYLQYGIDEEGLITYEFSRYQRGKCNEELGVLYSYDEGRVLYNPNLGEYVSVNGVSLNLEIDYRELEEAIDRIIQEQNANFWTEEIKTSVYESQDALVSFMLSMQEERFFGYDVKELAQIMSQIDPMECIRITPDGLVMVDFEEDFWRDSNSLAKWLTGACCAITIAGCIAVDLFIPALAPVSGAIMGTATEVFMQVVLNNQALADVNWKKVAVAAASGALMSWACPMVAGRAAGDSVKIFGKMIQNEKLLEGIGKAAGYAALSASNSVVSGLSSYGMTILDGGSQEEAIDAARMGAMMAAVCTIGSSALSEATTPAIQKLFENHPNNWFVKAVNEAGTFIGEHQVHLPEKLEKLESILVPKSIHQATKAAIDEIAQQRGDIVKRINALQKDEFPGFEKIDSKGNVISKEELVENGGNCTLRITEDCDPEVKKIFQRHNVTEIQIKEGVPDLKPISEYSFDANISSDRKANMKKFREYLADRFSRKPEEMPERLKAGILASKGMDHLPENITKTDILKGLSTASLTLHEGADGMVHIIDTTVHETIRHSGGVSLAKLNDLLAVLRKDFKKISTSAPQVIVSTYVEEAVYE
ncbi:MAG: hypothetical protein IJ123_01420 [Blautia sp.]|nr:hypothetical protein [Blautia sp.]